MMLFHLIKKDILIAKTLVIITMLLVIAVPLFSMLAAPSISGFPSFLYVVVLVEVLLLQSISQLEAKNPKAAALLCAAPYTRSMLIKAKYVFFILLFAYCYIVHTILALIISPASILDLTSILTVLLCSAVVYGIYMPIEFKYGVVKGKFIFLITIFLLSLGPAVFEKFFADVDFSGFVESIAAIPVILKCGVLAVLSAIALIVSAAISMRGFAGKEL